MLNLKTSTDQALLQRLPKAVTRQLTADELRRQKISFIMSSLSDGNTVTRAQVEQMLDGQEGK